MNIFTAYKTMALKLSQTQAGRDRIAVRCASDHMRLAESKLVRLCVLFRKYWACVLVFRYFRMTA